MGETRRDFLKIAALGGAGLLLGNREAKAGTGERSELNAELFDMMEQMQYELQVKKMELKLNSKENKEITPEIKHLIQELIRYEQTIETSLGEGVEMTQNSLWQTLENFFPGRPHTAENFYKILYTDIPKLLAEYGIIVKVTTNTWTDRTGVIQYADASFDFYNIEQIETDEVEYDGEKFRRDVAHVKGLELDGKKVANKPLWAQGVAEAYGQNVLIHQEAWDAQEEADKRNYQYDYDYFVGKTTDSYLIDQLKRTPPQDQDRAGVEASYTRLSREFFLKRQKGDEYSAVTSHEAGHIRTYSDSEYVKAHAPASMRTSADLEQQRISYLETEEMYAKICEIILGKNKYLALSYIIKMEETADASDIEGRGHLRANRKLQEAIAQEILGNASFYGVHIDDNSPISRRNQALFQVADIAKDKAKVVHLGGVLLARYHQDNHLSDIPDMMPAIPSMRPGAVKPKEKLFGKQLTKTSGNLNPCGSGVGFGISGTLAVVGVSYMLYKWWAGRVKEVREEEERKERERQRTLKGGKGKKRK